MAFSDLQGALVNLKLVTVSDLAKLLTRLQLPEVWRDAGCREAPDLEKLKKRILHDKSFVAWAVEPVTGGKSLGFVGVVSYSGPPYIFYDLPDWPAFDYVHDIVLALLPAFFQNAHEDRLFLHLEPELAEKWRDGILEGGFDPVGPLPGVDAKTNTSFVLERSTFEIYYGAGGEDERSLEPEDEEAEA